MIAEGFVLLRQPGCGFLDTNGPFYAKKSAEALWIGMPIEPRHCNAAGVAHGGMIMTLCDVMLAAGSNLTLNLMRYMTTVNFSCDFVGGATAGTWVEGRIDVIRQTRNFVFAQTLLQSADGSPIARASGTFTYRGEPDPRFSAQTYLG